MLAFGNEAFEKRLGLRDRVGPRDADDIEAVRACGLLQLRLDGPAVQKSRSG
jgi:hypothetical protein